MFAQDQVSPLLHKTGDSAKSGPVDKVQQTGKTGLWVSPQIPSKWDIIPLTQGKVALVDSADVEKIIPHTWCASNQHGKWYAMATIDCHQVTLHRFILDFPSSEVDHINGDGLDCRRSNMRLATRSQNCANRDRPRNCKSQYRGVTRLERNKKWMAQIKVNGKHKYLGSFTDEVEAAKVYDVAAREAFGDHARTNF